MTGHVSVVGCGWLWGRLAHHQTRCAVMLAPECFDTGPAIVVHVLRHHCSKPFTSTRVKFYLLWEAGLHTMRLLPIVA